MRRIPEDGRQMREGHPGLRETRQQGTASFPCTMYFADWERDGREVFEVKPHWHDALELLHFERGVFELGIGMEHFLVDSEAFAFVESGTLHAIRSPASDGENGAGHSGSGGEDGRRPAGFGSFIEQALLFAPSLLANENDDAASREIIGPLARGELRLPRLIRAGEPGFADVAACFGRVRAVFAARGEIHDDQRFLTTGAAQLRVKAALMELLASLQEEGRISVSETEPDERMEALKRTLTYIREHYAAKIYLRDLAGIMNMNEQYFCRFFRRVVGRTPVAYINEVRLKRAALLLEQTDRQVVDVAQACGFGNMGHFISAFRKMTGCTPLAYRQMYRKKEIMH